MSVCCKLFCLNAYFLSGDYTRTLHRKKNIQYIYCYCKTNNRVSKDQMLIYTEPRMRKHLDFTKKPTFLPSKFQKYFIFFQ